MARYVVDARTLVHIVSADVPIHPEYQLVSPNSVRSEALALLYDEVRRGEISEAEALRLHERMTEVKLRLLGDRVSRRTAWRIAGERGWDSLGGAEYLAWRSCRPPPSSPLTRTWPARQRAWCPSRSWRRSGQRVSTRRPNGSG